MAKEEKSFRATGRRKEAVARVILKPKSGSYTVNGDELKDYFKNDRLVIEVEKPLTLVERKDEYTVWARIDGGGLAGQAHALRLGIARALCEADESFRAVLKKNGLLTRDSRVVERKKYGKKGARRGFQFSKR